MIELPIRGVVREPDGWCVTMDVPPDTEYVRGHFPGAPILPAVAQLALVAQAASASWERPVAIAAIVDLRFRGRVAPGDRLTLRLPVDGDDERARFRIEADGRLVSQGLVRFAPAVDRA